MCIERILTACCFIIALFFSSCQSDAEYNARIEAQRQETQRFFKKSPDSPLDNIARITFKGLAYYKPNSDFRIEAELVRLPVMAPYTMQFSGGDAQPYHRFAELHFELDGKKQVLTAYQHANMVSAHQLFVPFTDMTSGKETYNGGRYLNIVFNPATSQVMLDFNEAYAPYCAYTHSYSCPVVPKENHVTAEVKAGERN